MWARNICDMYLGKTKTGQQLDLVNSMTIGLNDMGNPANPHKIFTVKEALGPCLPHGVHPSQADWAQYAIDNGGVITWQFPSMDPEKYPHHVLKMQFHECRPSVFCYRWLPEYQHGKLEPMRELLAKDIPALASRWEEHLTGNDHRNKDYTNPLHR